MESSFAIGLVVHPSKPVAGSVRLITDFARTHGDTVLARESDAARVGPDVALVPDEGFADRLSALVALGGDGTTLGAMRLVVEPGAALTLRLRADAVNVVRLDADSHARRSRIKLSLLDLPVKPDQLLELIPARLREELRTLRAPVPPPE